jgi:hypothetical protein
MAVISRDSKISPAVDTPSRRNVFFAKWQPLYRLWACLITVMLFVKRFVCSCASLFPIGGIILTCTFFCSGGKGGYHLGPTPPSPNMSPLSTYGTQLQLLEGSPTQGISPQWVAVEIPTCYSPLHNHNPHP